MRIGILALQGAFIEHAAMLARLGAEPRPVRLPEELDGLDGLIIPGGESTTIGKLAVQYGLVEPLKAFSARHPMWGVCAGLIFMARDIGGLEQPLLGVMDVVVERNAFGRQVDSFETELSVPELNGHGPTSPPCHAIFIRWPIIRSVGPGVRVLAALSDRSIVAVRQRHLLATAFHPELSDDPRFHRYFLGMVAE
jgi:5'-phosphate synthase pdxT subunit